MFGSLGKLWKAWRIKRKFNPAIRLLKKEGSMKKLKSRKLWVTAGVALLMSVATQLGMEPDALAKFNEALLWLTGLYFGANVGEHGADAIKAKKGT